MKPLWKRVARIIAAVAVAFGPALAHANLELTFDITTSVEMSAADIAAGHGSAKPRTETTTLVLGPGYFIYETRSSRLIYDFAGRRVYVLDAESNTYSSDSLYADIGFRSQDFKARLAAGAAAPNAMEPPLLEQLFSLREKTGSSRTLAKKAGKETAWSWQDRQLIAYGNDGIAVTPEENAAFIRYFRYRFRGHPQILEEMRKLVFIPTHISISNYDAGRRKTTALKIVSYRKLPDAAFSLAGLIPTPNLNPDMQAIIASADPAPARATALLQLGITYYSNRDTASAWAAWDTARALDPANPGLKTVDDIQQLLVTDYPEFF